MMESGQKVPSKTLDYNVGALIVLVASSGAAAIVYSLILTFNLFNLPAWLFGPLGVYTLAYALIARKDSTYYVVWGGVMVAIALVSACYNVLNPLVILGVLAIVIAITGIVAYQRSKK
jgi:hypothetical protein